MRIIAGSLRGKKILQPQNNVTRPLKDLTKESIFNIIHHSNLFECKLTNSRVLDLFSGVGSFGLECLSRGAKSVWFCENNSTTLEVLRKNISLLDCEDKSKIISNDAFAIDSIKDIYGQKYEIIFLDPPYKEKNLVNLIKKIINLKLLKKNGIIIIHRHKKEKDIFPENFNIIKEKNYGISKIIFGN